MSDEYKKVLERFKKVMEEEHIEIEPNMQDYFYNVIERLIKDLEVVR